MAEFICEQCPYYMNMGVSYDEYWHGDYTKLPYYRKAYALKQKETNQKLWMQGVYFFLALESIVPKSNVRYPEEPIPLTVEEMHEAEERDKQKQISTARTYMESAMKKINKARKEGGKKND